MEHNFIVITNQDDVGCIYPDTLFGKLRHLYGMYQFGLITLEEYRKALEYYGEVV